VLFGFGVYWQNSPLADAIAELKVSPVPGMDTAEPATYLGEREREREREKERDRERERERGLGGRERQGRHQRERSDKNHKNHTAQTVLWAE
jgi:hypothetical protein